MFTKVSTLFSLYKLQCHLAISTHILIKNKSYINILLKSWNSLRLLIANSDIDQHFKQDL